MALFSKKQTISDNRIENTGRWPIRLTDFYLVDDYEFPPSQYTEIFLVRSGHFLHETEHGTQAVRSGTAMVHHPSSRHVIKQPEQVRLSRIRFLPEWFAHDYRTVMDSPDVFGLFFTQSWFELPTDTNLHVFTTRQSQLPFLDAIFDLLSQALQANRHAEPMARIALLEIMLLLGDEYHTYWRGGNRVPLPEKTAASLDIIERSVSSGGRIPLKALQAATGLNQDKLSKAMRKSIGLTLVDYVQRRRLQHAARQLLGSADSPEFIAESCALNDLAQFEKEFEKAFDFVPTVYREKFGAVRDASHSPDDAEEEGNA